ncbi:MAG: class I SAM-dependent methyltransferase [Bacteroidota bacterium]
MNQQPFDYATIPVGYYDRVFASQAGVQSKWHHLKFERMRAAIAGCRRHLDIGCSAGTFIGTLAPGQDSVGIDLAEAQIDYARQHHGGPNRRFEVVPAGPLPYADGAFDAVTVVELIEHLPAADNLVLLREAARVLEHGGRLVVSTPNYGSLWPVLEGLVNRLGEVDYSDQHITHYTRSSLAALMAEAGLRDVRVEGYLFAAPFAAALDWGLADRVDRLEPRFLTDRLGFLLIATGTK